MPVGLTGTTWDLKAEERGGEVENIDLKRRRTGVFGDISFVKKV